MSNGDEVTRKSHIKRIYQNDDTESSVWIDVERLDELRFVSRKDYPWREKRWRFDWDTFNPDGENVTKKKVKQHRDDPDSDSIEVPVRDMVFVTEGREQKYQAYRHFFINNDSNSTRETHSRRIYHHDIAEESLDDQRNPPRDPDAYLNALSDQDEGQFIDVELLDKYWTNENESRDAHGNKKEGVWQEKKWLLNDKDVDPLLKEPLLDSDKINLEDFQGINNPSGGGLGDVAGSVTVDPPWRLDPLQNIINVNWGGLAVIFGEGASDAPKQDKG